jgi:hypothetical protein
MGRIMIGRLRLTTSLWIGLGLLVLAGCAGQPTPTASQAQAPGIEPGRARVWVLRQADPPARNIEAARPMVFANGAPIAESKEGTAFFHDFPPGTYRFTVQAYGTPAGRSEAVQLAAGMQTYIQVQAVPNWEQGSSVGGWSFAVLPMSPEIAQQYLPTMTNLGRL